MAHAKRRISHHWPERELEPERKAHEAHLAPTKPVQALPLQPIWPGRLAFTVASAVFAALGIAAATGSVSIWIGIVAVVGLAGTGLAYVAGWALDDASPF